MAKIILINLAVFAFFLLIQIIDALFKSNIELLYIQPWFALPSDLLKLATRPWTFITYMFTHQGFLHLFFNMLFLFMFGRIFMGYLGGRKFLSIYLLGGLAGGLLYVLFYNIFPAFTESVAIGSNRGASAAVMAIVVATATYNPNLEVRLFFVLPVKIVWIAVFFVVSDLIYLPDVEGNFGGHIAHLGGAIVGYTAIRQLQKGKDITEGFSRFMDSVANWFKAKPKVRKVYSNTSKAKTDVDYNARKIGNQKKMDEILDKNKPLRL